jgi:hypothetical protein
LIAFTVSWYVAGRPFNGLGASNLQFSTCTSLKATGSGGSKNGAVKEVLRDLMFDGVNMARNVNLIGAAVKEGLLELFMS